MKEIVIGSLEQFTKFPAEVLVDYRSYYLIEENGGYKLMSRDCPHAGGTVNLQNGDLVCPIHWWTFEAQSGKCRSVPGFHLTSYEVNLLEGNLIAALP